MRPVIGPIVVDATSGIPVPSVLAPKVTGPFLYASWSAEGHLLERFAPAVKGAITVTLLGVAETQRFDSWLEASAAILSEDRADAVWAAEVALHASFQEFDLGVFPESDGVEWSVIAWPVTEAARRSFELLPVDPGTSH